MNEHEYKFSLWNKATQKMGSAMKMNIDNISFKVDT